MTTRAATLGRGPSRPSPHCGASFLLDTSEANTVQPTGLHDEYEMLAWFEGDLVSRFDFACLRVSVADSMQPTWQLREELRCRRSNLV
jgi:hypothetical protein